MHASAHAARCFLSSSLPAGGAGGAHVPAVGLDEDVGGRIFVLAGDHSRAGIDGHVHQRQTPDGVAQSGVARYPGNLLARSESVPQYRKTTLLVNLLFLAVAFPLMFRLGSLFMLPLYEGSSLYMPTALPGISITQASQLLQDRHDLSSAVCQSLR